MDLHLVFRYLVLKGWSWRKTLDEGHHHEIKFPLNGYVTTPTSVPHRDSIFPDGAFAVTHPQTGNLYAELVVSNILSTSFFSKEMTLSQTLTLVSKAVCSLSLFTSGISGLPRLGCCISLAPQAN